MKKIASFDVFETLIARAVSPHQAVFDEVARRARRRRLLPGISVAAFAAAREQAERRAAKNRGQCFTLGDCYDELCHGLSIPVTLRDALYEIEIATEIDLLRPVETARPLLSQARADGYRVVFVSDMYLPGAVIRQALQNAGMWQDGDSLYVSCEHGCSKADGALFRRVAEAEGVAVESILHHGNNWRVDVEGARRAGAGTRFLDAGNPARYEQVMHRYRGTTDGAAAALAGASRLARLSAPTEAAPGLVGPAAGVFAPLLIGFTLWVLRQAYQAGLERLYFISRDGEILVALARALAPKFGLSIEARYLHGSRLSWNGAVSSPHEAQWIWDSLMWRGSGRVSNRKMLRRPGLEPAEIEELIHATGLTEAELQSVSPGHAALRAALVHPAAQPLLAQARARLHQRLVAYLAQEGALDPCPMGFVDIGWRATQHDVLNILRSEAGLEPTQGYFLGLEDTPSPFHATREAYLANGHTGLGDHPFGTGVVPPLFPLIELVCTSLSGSVVSYTCRDGRVEPVLSAGNPALAAWGLPCVHSTIVSVAEQLSISPDVLHPSADLRPMLRTLLEEFWNQPSPEEAQAWGSFPWETGQAGEETMTEFAPPFRLRRALTVVIQRPSLLWHPGRWALHASNSQWKAASLARASAAARLAYGGAPAVRALLRPQAVRRALGRVKRAARS
ncbi:MAG: HAD family hydrolase [Rubricoccaceae bacterium]